MVHANVQAVPLRNLSVHAIGRLIKVVAAAEGIPVVLVETAGIAKIRFGDEALLPLH
jgi:hypothetical protein